MGGYLGLGSPQHVLLLLKDGIHTLKELHALLGNPVETRKQTGDSSLKIEMKYLDDMLIYVSKWDEMMNYHRTTSCNFYLQIKIICFLFLC